MSITIPKLPNDITYEHQLFVILTGKGLHEPEKEFGENGHMFCNKYLTRVKGNIAIFPKEIVAAFVNIDLKRDVDEGCNERVKYRITMMTKPEAKYWHAAILGNLAYVILNSKDNTAVELAQNLYNSYDMYLGNKVLQIIDEINKEEKQISHPYWASSWN